ncbi:MAG: amidase [Betaproteobacteria bacterium]|nr:amidase [Betaproteobacteria bacterium]
MPESLNTLSAAEAARRIAAGELTSEALVAACLARIAAREPEVQAWAFLDPQLALAQARALDGERPRGPLHGVPVGIKDVIDTADMPTEYNSPIYRGHRPRADAACVAVLRRAGCVILGKTVTTEFANNHPARTRNPRNLAHTPGGSSSGSAAAVADGMVPLALGTQTGGSTIRPASYCGVTGMKPSFNSINRAGLKFVAESLDTIGLFARGAEDVALLLHVLSRRALPDSGVTAGRKPRVGLFRTPRWQEADAAAQDAVESAAARLEKAGAHVTPFAAPDGYAALYDEQERLMRFETALALAWEHAHHAGELSASLRLRIEDGWALSRAGYDSARQHARDVRRRLAEAMQDCDFLVTPGTTGEAPATLASTGNSLFNRVWTLLGVPCVTLPFGTGPAGLPLGVQLVGAFDRDTELLGWSVWAEQNFKAEG